MFLIHDASPEYVLFIVQCSRADGTVLDPSVDALRVYEIDGSIPDFTNDNEISGSPFDPIQFNSKIGLWGIKIDKASFVINKQYLLLWEMTIDGVTAAKQEVLNIFSSSVFKASGFSTFDPASDTVTIENTEACKATGFLTQSELDTHQSTVLNAISAAQSVIDGISNVTRVSTSLPKYIPRPTIGTQPIRVDIAIKDMMGNMEDPDNNAPTIYIVNSSGIVRQDNLYQDSDLTTPLVAFPYPGPFNGLPVPVRGGLGRYYFFIGVSPSTPEETLSVWIGFEENGQALYEFKETQVLDMNGDMPSIASDVSAIKAKTDNLPDDPASQASVNTSIQNNVSGLSTFDPTSDLVIVGNPDDCKADISLLAIEATSQSIKSSADKIDGLVENVDGNRFTAKALENIPEVNVDISMLPSATDIVTEMDNSSSKLAFLDTTISSRLAGENYEKCDVSGLPSQESIDAMQVVVDEISDDLKSISITGSNAVSIKAKDADGNNIPYVKITIKTLADVLLWSGFTDLNGSASVSMDNGDYKFLASRPGYIFPEIEQTINGSLSVVFSGDNGGVTLQPPENALDCRIAVPVSGVSGSELVKPEDVADAYARIINLPLNVDGRYFAGTQMPASFDYARQEIYFIVVQNAEIYIHIPLINYKQTVSVPNQSFHTV